MDVALAKTFLEVVSSGNFAAAANNLNVTQSAISMRIQKLEDALGHRLLDRSKGGVRLTPYGYQFEPYARTMIQVWDEARYNIALPEKFDISLSIGCQYSLWPELGVNWLEIMEAEMLDVSFNVHLGAADRLTRLMANGIVDMSLVYTPEMRPGLRSKHIMDDKLVHVTGFSQHTGGLDPYYVYMDWGQEFANMHSRWYPDFRLSRTSMKIGAGAVTYFIRNEKSGFLPYRVADDFVADGKLYFVPDAPEMDYPAYIVWSASKHKRVIDEALDCLERAVKKVPMLEF